jgi:hypothetical protein
MAIREGRWRCASCGRENLGRFEQCRGCPAGRTSDTAFYLPDGEPAISDEELIADAMSGNDWHCDHCENSNKGSDHKCWSCSNPRDHSDKEHDASRDVVMSPATSEPKHERPKSRPDRVRASSRAPSSAPSARSSRSANSSPLNYMFLGLIALLVALSLLAASFLVSFDADGSITGKKWSRAIPIEQIKPVEDDGWTRPSGAYDVTSRQKIRSHKVVVIGHKNVTKTVDEKYKTGTEQYKCGTKSLGNGYFEDKMCSRNTYATKKVEKTDRVAITERQPVYDTWYEYTEDRWVTVRTKRSSGTSDEPYWPEYTLAQRVERVGSKSQSYTVEMQIGENVQKKNLPKTEWDGYLIGDALDLKTNFWGQVKSVGNAQ